MIAELRVAAPEALSVERLVFPVTARVPPIVVFPPIDALLVMFAELSVASPEVVRVDKLVLPTTARFPPMPALPVLLSVVLLIVVTDNELIPATLFAPLVALLILIVPESIPPDSELAPVTAKAPDIDVFPLVLLIVKTLVAPLLTAKPAPDTVAPPFRLAGPDTARLLFAVTAPVI
jgi:hypothetical protein